MGERVSVIVPTKGRSKHLREALASLNAQSFPVHELVLVDDSSEDEYRQNEAVVLEFASQGGKFPIRQVKGRGKGAADARNQGAELSEGEILSFIDDDVVLDKDYYLRMMESFSDPTVAGVTGVVTNPHVPSGIWLLFSKVFFLSTVSHSKGHMRRSGYPCYLLDSQASTEVGVMSGCNMSLRRAVFMEHLFDPRLSGYSYLEDADLTHRISKDHRLLLDPRCQLVHNTADRAVSERYFTIKLSYHRYIFQKNFGRNPLNYVPFALSIFADLVLVMQRAKKDGNRNYVSAALSGLSESSGP
jgi:glycosyltransferase involved in cell wall biosynthesis